MLSLFVPPTFDIRISPLNKEDYLPPLYSAQVCFVVGAIFKVYIDCTLSDDMAITARLLCRCHSPLREQQWQFRSGLDVGPGDGDGSLERVVRKNFPL